MEGHHPKPKLATITLKQASASDIDQLIELETSVGHLKTYSAMLTPEEWQEEMKTGQVYFIVSNKNIVGNISFSQKGPDHLHLSGLMIHPDYQGQKFAKRALQKVLDDHRGMKRIDLVTHPNNPALNMYQSLGFKIESLQENYFGDGEPRLVLVIEK